MYLDRSKERVGNVNKRAVGSTYEQQAADLLREAGCEILTMNYRNRFGEIDIIAKDGPTYVFCEVKYRKTSKAGDPMEAVTPSKQETIRSVASYFLAGKRIPEDTPVRFDIIAILGEKATHLKNAF